MVNKRGELGRAATLILSMTGPVLLCLTAYDQPHFVEELLSADTLLPAAFAYDLTHFSNVMAWFQLPRVQSIVPDLVLYGLNQGLTGDWRIAHFSFGLFSLLAMAVIATVVIGQSVKCTFAEGGLAFQAIALPVLFLELHDPQQEGAFHFSLFHPASHGGQFVPAIGAAVLTWTAIQSRAPLLPTSMVAFLSLRSCAADDCRGMPFEAEAVEQRLLHHPPLPSSTESPLTRRRESATDASIKRSFSTQSSDDASTFVVSCQARIAYRRHPLSDRTLQVSRNRRGKDLTCFYTDERPDLARELPN
jgi:hypothetical protein